MTIGIDVDDTITKTTETLNSVPGLTRELFDEIFTRPDSVPDLDERLKEVFGNMEVFDNAIEVINDLKSKGNKIVIITARGGILDVLVPITKKFIKDKGIKIDDAIFYQERKGDACIKAGVDIFIDDNEIVLDEVKETGIPTIRFSEVAVNSKHQVIHSWLELKDYLSKWGDNNGKNN